MNTTTLTIPKTKDVHKVKIVRDELSATTVKLFLNDSKYPYVVKGFTNKDSMGDMVNWAKEQISIYPAQLKRETDILSTF